MSHRGEGCGTNVRSTRPRRCAGYWEVGTERVRLRSGGEWAYVGGGGLLAFAERQSDHGAAGRLNGGLNIDCEKPGHRAGLFGLGRTEGVDAALGAADNRCAQWGNAQVAEGPAG